MLIEILGLSSSVVVVLLDTGILLLLQGGVVLGSVPSLVSSLSPVCLQLLFAIALERQDLAIQK